MNCHCGLVLVVTTTLSLPKSYQSRSAARRSIFWRVSETIHASIVPLLVKVTIHTHTPASTAGESPSSTGKPSRARDPARLVLIATKPGWICTLASISFFQE